MSPPHEQGTVPEVGLRSHQECDHSGDERLEGREVEEFCRRLLRRPELEELFGRYSGEDRVLSAEELRDFLRDQGEDASLRQARAVIRAYELNEKGRAEDSHLASWVVVGWALLEPREVMDGVGMGLCLVVSPPKVVWDPPRLG